MKKHTNGFSKLREFDTCRQFITPLHDAVEEITRRRQDTVLIKKVNDFLNGDIPTHFKNKQPILYLARHIATPNFETLRFIELAKPYKLPIIIGQDLKDKFVSTNSLKRSLGKMSVMKGSARNGDEIIENFTIINFDTAQGRPFKDIYTRFGEKLVDFHRDLFNIVYPDDIQIIDESAWIDRNDRGDLVAHYKKTLTLLLIHGIMFEYYEPEDVPFVQNILKPAFEEVKKEFNIAPLITTIVPPELENEKDWNSYPSVIYAYIKKLYAKRAPVSGLCIEEKIHVKR